MFLIRLTMAMTMTMTTRIGLAARVGSTLPRSSRGFGAVSDHPGLIQILGYAYMVRWLPADSLYSRCLSLLSVIFSISILRTYT